MNFGELKMQARQAVHDTLSVPAFYMDAMLDEPVSVTVRHHTRIEIHGLSDNDYANVLEGINRLIFSKANLGDLVLRRGGMVNIPVYGLDLRLDAQEPDDGPINTYWSVVDAT